MITINKRQVDGFVPWLALSCVAFMFKVLQESLNKPFVCVMSNPTDIHRPYIIEAASFFKYTGCLDDLPNPMEG